MLGEHGPGSDLRMNEAYTYVHRRRRRRRRWFATGRHSIDIAELGRVGLVVFLQVLAKQNGKDGMLWNPADVLLFMIKFVCTSRPDIPTEGDKKILQYKMSY